MKKLENKFNLFVDYIENIRPDLNDIKQSIV